MRRSETSIISKIAVGELRLFIDRWGVTGVHVCNAHVTAAEIRGSQKRVSGVLPMEPETCFWRSVTATVTAFGHWQKLCQGTYIPAATATRSALHPLGTKARTGYARPSTSWEWNTHPVLWTVVVLLDVLPRDLGSGTCFGYCIGLHAHTMNSYAYNHLVPVAR